MSFAIQKSVIFNHGLLLYFRIKNSFSNGFKCFPIKTFSLLVEYSSL